MIPPIAHFIWLGNKLPDLAWLAVRMAVANGGFARIEVWTDNELLAADRRVQALTARYPVSIRPLTDCSDLPDARALGPRLLNVVGSLKSPAAKADVWRLRIVWQFGGIYLDSDALVLRSFEQLRHHRTFVGLEHVCLPAALYATRNPLRWGRAAGLLVLRHSLTVGSGAAARFSKVAGLFDLACNNAVFGAEPHSATVTELLQRAAALPDLQAQALYELGPRLWEAATANQTSAACAVLPPEAFYPLGPEVCADYVAADAAGTLGQAPAGAPFAAHLYDSVLSRRLGHAITGNWLHAHRTTTLLGRMVDPFLDEWRDLA